MDDFYSQAFEDSQLHVATGASMARQRVLPHLADRKSDVDSKLNLFLLPDRDCAEESPATSFDKLSLALRRAVVTSPHARSRPLTTSAKLSEKGWFAHAAKSWDAVRSGQFYVEYSRLMT